MSRVHDALRKASNDLPNLPQIPAPRPPVPGIQSPVIPAAYTQPQAAGIPAAHAVTVLGEPLGLDDLGSIIDNAPEIPFRPSPDAMLVNPMKPREAPGEEFRTLRTRLNHLQSTQPLHTLVVTSASPAEGKSFTATNLALAQAQLSGKRVLLTDFDFRRPTVDKVLQIECAPGITDYLTGQVPLSSIVRKVADVNLYVMTAGSPVPNPLELLNLKECKELIDGLREYFDWVILDSPPLLFAADGNLLSTMCDGTILVVRIGATTFDSVTRAMQSLCENNVLGVVVNGARRGELYSKYTYYHDYYKPEGKHQGDKQLPEPVAPAGV